MSKDYRAEATFDGGVMRWRSNGRVPFDDVLREAKAAGFAVDLTACTLARDDENAVFLAEYRRNPPAPTEEHRAEARAAHGPGVTLVDIVSGRKFTT